MFFSLFSKKGLPKKKNMYGAQIDDDPQSLQLLVPNLPYICDPLPPATSPTPLESPPLLRELKEEFPAGEQEALPSQADTNPETNSKTDAGTQRLLDLGFQKGPSSDLCMKFQSNDEVLAFMKKKAFLQSAGGQNNGEYKKWRCAHAYTAAKCPFVLFQFGDFQRPNCEFTLTLGKKSVA